jgi:hypothetical protein
MLNYESSSMYVDDGGKDQVFTQDSLDRNLNKHIDHD